MLTIPDPEISRLGIFSQAGLFSWNLFRTSRDYFQSQIMTPPKKKKSFFKTVYEKITGKIPTIPQLDPAKPNRSQSIDDLVA